GQESWRELSGRSVRGAHFQGVPLKNDLAQRERYLTARHDATPIGQWPEADGFDLFERLPVRVGRTAAAQQDRSKRDTLAADRHLYDCVLQNLGMRNGREFQGREQLAPREIALQ